MDGETLVLLTSILSLTALGLLMLWKDMVDVLVLSGLVAGVVAVALKSAALMHIRS